MSTRKPPPAEPDASVVVVTHNNEAIIEQCLSSISGAADTSVVEVIVVDNGSRDATLARVAESPVITRVLSLSENVGFAAAVNAGIAASAGEFVVLVNSDAFPDRASVDRLIGALREEPGAGIVGARLRYGDGRLQPSFGSFPSLKSTLWLALLLHRVPILGRAGVGVGAHPSLYRTRRRLDWVSGAFCAARRAVGPIPTDRFLFGEEITWAQACHQAGLRVLLEPAATAVHIGGATISASRAVGYAQVQRVEFELEWFSNRGALAARVQRALLAVHALIRIPVYCAVSVARWRRDARLAEQLQLLRSALRRGPDAEAGA